MRARLILLLLLVGAFPAVADDPADDIEFDVVYAPAGYYVSW